MELNSYEFEKTYYHQSYQNWRKGDEDPQSACNGPSNAFPPFGCHHHCNISNAPCPRCFSISGTCQCGPREGRDWSIRDGGDLANQEAMKLTVGFCGVNEDQFWLMIGWAMRRKLRSFSNRWEEQISKSRRDSDSKESKEREMDFFFFFFVEREDGHYYQ